MSQRCISSESPERADARHKKHQKDCKSAWRVDSSGFELSATFISIMQYMLRRILGTDAQANVNFRRHEGHSPDAFNSDVASTAELFREYKTYFQQ